MRALFLLLLFLSAASVFGAVEPDENLLANPTFEADQASVPPGWIARGGACLACKAAGGPDGLPYVSITDGGGRKPAEEVNLRQHGLILSPKGRYRISLKVRTCGFSADRVGFGFINTYWKQSAAIRKVPSDTHGEWVKLEEEFSCFESCDNYHAFVIYCQNNRGTLDVADCRRCAADAAALEGTMLSETLRSLAVRRIVPLEPILAKIPENDRCVTFRCFGRIPQGRDGDLEFRLKASDATDVSAMPFARGGLKVELPAGARAGWLAAELVDRRTGEQLVSDRFRFKVVAPPGKCATPHRRLNNLATEVLNGRWTGARGGFDFWTARDGWVFTQVRASGAALKVKLDGREVIAADTPRLETFREIPAGVHQLEVEGAADGGAAVVRSVAEIYNYCPGFSNRIPHNGQYDRAFQEKYTLPAVTTQCGGRISDSDVAEMKARGYKWIQNVGTGAKKADEVMSLISDSAGQNDPRYDGTSCDEQFFTHFADQEEYLRGLRAFDAARESDRPLYTWIVGKPSTAGLDEAFFSAAVNACGGRSKLAFEAYGRTQAREEDVIPYLKDYIAGTISSYRRWFPLAVGSSCVIFGNFTQIPILSVALHPDVDFKRFLDMEVREAATDPEFAGIGCVGWWGSYYADEELHRWSFALMRHYVVEGRTTLLSEKYGYAYRPGLIKDGDFAQGLAAWRSKGPVRAGSYEGYAKTSQNRWAPYDNVGDTFAVLERTEEIAAVGQEASGFVPGRRYLLRFATVDYDDLVGEKVNPRKLGVEVRFGKGAEIDPSRSWCWVDDRDNSRGQVRYGNPRKPTAARINYRQVLFTATAETIRIAFDNSPAKPGERIALNCVSLTPYFEPVQLGGYLVK